MLEPLTEIARTLKVHPRDLARAVDTGRLDAWDMSGEIFIDHDQAAALNLPAWTWTTMNRWALDHRTTVPMVLTRIRAGALEGFDGGKFRRWILEPADQTGVR